MQYSKGNLHIEMALNYAMEKMESIFIDYNMEKSIKEQDSANNKEE